MVPPFGVAGSPGCSSVTLLTVDESGWRPEGVDGPRVSLRIAVTVN